MHLSSIIISYMATPLMLVMASPISTEASSGMFPLSLSIYSLVLNNISNTMKGYSFAKIPKALQLRDLESFAKRCIQLGEPTGQLEARGCSWPAFVTHIKKSDTPFLQEFSKRCIQLGEPTEPLEARGCSWPAFVTHIKKSEVPVLQDFSKRCIQLGEPTEGIEARGCSWPAFVTHIKRNVE
jgi:hypothetical protein